MIATVAGEHCPILPDGRVRQAVWISWEFSEETDVKKGIFPAAAC